MAQRIAVLKSLSVICLSHSANCFLMLYGSYAWTTATEENVKRVFKLQKQAARVILDANINDRSKELFRRLWLPFKDEVNLQKCSLIYRRIRNEDDG